MNEHSTALSCQKCPINVFNCLILWFIFCCIHFEQVYFKTVTILFVNFYPCRGYCVYFLIQSHRYFGEGNGTPLQYSCWKIPWMEEPGRRQSTGSRRVGHDWATSLSLFTFLHWRRTWQPTPVFLPGESQGWGSLVVAVYGVTQSWTRLKWLSSSSSSIGILFIQSHSPSSSYLLSPPRYPYDCSLHLSTYALQINLPVSSFLETMFKTNLCLNGMP